MDWTTIITALIGVFVGAGFWEVIKTVVGKKKSPYELFMQMVEEERNFYRMRNEEYERERFDSAEKSAVISQSHKCLHRFSNPEIICPVEVANDARLQNRCTRCEYNHKESAAE